jgi:hypothetical protein
MPNLLEEAANNSITPLADEHFNPGAIALISNDGGFGPYHSIGELYAPADLCNQLFAYNSLDPRLVNSLESIAWVHKPLGDLSVIRQDHQAG